MDSGISPSELAQTGNQPSDAIGPTFWILLLLAVGTVAGKIYISWGDRVQISSWLGNASGGALIGLGAMFFIVGIFLTDREVRTWILIRQNLIDPFVVTVLQTDSCNPQNDRFCVVVWEPEGREIVVNWHDKRVDAFSIYNDLELTLYASARPRSRPGVLAD